MRRKARDALSGSLFQRTTGRLKGRWVLTVVADDGKPRQTLAPVEIRTPQQAHAWAGALHAATPPPPRRRRHDGPTVAAIAEKWLTYREVLRDRDDPQIAPSTVKDNRSHIVTHILPALGGEPLASLTVPRLRQWVATLHGSPQTVRNIVSTLATMIDDAIGEGWTTLRGNPAREESLRKVLPATVRERRTVIDPLAAADLCSSALIPEPRRVRYALAFLGGLRDGEIAGLRIRDVDCDHSLITVEQAYTTLRAVGKTKTRGSVRALPLHPMARKAVAAWLKHGWRIWACAEPTPDSPLLPGVGGSWTRPRSADALRADLERIGAPVPNGVAFRHARTSFASWLRAAGVRRETIGSLLGHEGRSVTDRHYAEHEMLELRDAVHQIGLVITVIDSVICDHDGAGSAIKQAPPALIEKATRGLGNRCSAVIASVRRRGWQRTHRAREAPRNG
jgi:integrase